MKQYYITAGNERVPGAYTRKREALNFLKIYKDFGERKTEELEVVKENKNGCTTKIFVM